MGIKRVLTFGKIIYYEIRGEGDNELICQECSEKILCGLFQSSARKYFSSKVSSVFKILNYGDTVHCILRTSLTFIGLNIFQRIFLSVNPINFVQCSAKAFVFHTHREFFRMSVVSILTLVLRLNFKNRWLIVKIYRLKHRIY